MASELMEKAMKEGIDVDGPQDEGQPQETPSSGSESQTGANAATSPDAATSKDTGGGAKAVEAEKETSEPFHKNPRWQKMQRENEEFRGQIQDMRQKYEKLLESAILNPQRANEQTSLPQEQIQALRQLATLIKSDPEAAKILGLGSAKEIEQTVQAIQEERTSEAFWGEFDSTVKSFSDKYGFKTDDFSEELQEFLTSDPHFGQLSFSKGVVEKAAKALLFDKIGELKERETNLKLIKEKQEKANNNTEAPSKNKQGEGAKTDLSFPGAIMERIKAAGGLDI